MWLNGNSGIILLVRQYNGRYKETNNLFSMPEKACSTWVVQRILVRLSIFVKSTLKGQCHNIQLFFALFFSLEQTMATARANVVDIGPSQLGQPRAQLHSPNGVDQISFSTALPCGRHYFSPNKKGRHSGQSVTASDFGSNGPRFESGLGRCVESLDKALYSHCPKEKPSH